MAFPHREIQAWISDLQFCEDDRVECCVYGVALCEEALSFYVSHCMFSALFLAQAGGAIVDVR